MLIAAVVLGLLKARFVLRRAARRTIQHITSRGDGRCLGGFLSWKTWLLVIAMIALGRLLRSELVPIPLAWIGLLYAAVGVAMIAGSIPLWIAWQKTGTSP